MQCERPKCEKIKEMPLWNEERERESMCTNNVQVADSRRFIYWNVCECNKMQIPKTQNVRIIVQIWTKIQSICIWSHQMNVDFYIHKNWIEFRNCFLPIVYLFVEFCILEIHNLLRKINFYHFVWVEIITQYKIAKLASF